MHNTQAMTKSDEGNIGVFEWKILRKTFGPKRNNVREYEMNNNEKLDNLYKERTIIGTDGRHKYNDNVDIINVTRYEFTHTMSLLITFPPPPLNST